MKTYCHVKVILKLLKIFKYILDKREDRRTEKRTKESQTFFYSLDQQSKYKSCTKTKEN